MENKYRPKLDSFYTRVYELVDDPSTDSIISWSKSNKSFVIWKPEDLAHRKYLSRFYCRNKLPEFISHLIRFYGFKRMKGSEMLEFGHNKYFVRGKPELLYNLQRQHCMARMKRKWKARKIRLEVENRMQQLTI